jgi:hypothetical protein
MTVDPDAQATEFHTHLVQQFDARNDVDADVVRLIEDLIHLLVVDACQHKQAHESRGDKEAQSLGDGHLIHS